eukprot:CAMPEP_0170563852 /NCGR_PEP_ID=MMETSP0211-20121228/69277_1 /TAXON_ID=311385 /ORGANISM="Pseudokeronopsis sp., Strain OXSARD2" /LENGTH=45 /DNA_ID= /DNA_START= /DNA_END= /DNA_ORIENTATION=
MINIVGNASLLVRDLYMNIRDYIREYKRKKIKENMVVPLSTGEFD